MKKILYPSLFLIVFTLCISGCGGRPSPEETVNTILNRIQNRDFTSLEELAPFLSDLTEPDRETLRQSMEPYFPTPRHMDVKRQGIAGVTVFLSASSQGTPDMILSLKKGENNNWILMENISYTRSFDFIPLEKSE